MVCRVGCVCVWGEAAVPRFITQQPTLFGCIPGRVRDDFYNDDDNDEDDDNDKDHNKDEGNIYNNDNLFLLHNNQPWLDAFLAQWVGDVYDDDDDDNNGVDEDSNNNDNHNNNDVNGDGNDDK